MSKQQKFEQCPAPQPELRPLEKEEKVIKMGEKNGKMKVRENHVINLLP